jgi:hypothetical protein
MYVLDLAEDQNITMALPEEDLTRWTMRANIEGCHPYRDREEDAE